MSNEPVAWMHVQGSFEEPSLRQLDEDEIGRGWKQYPLYTNPAPDDTALLRQALDALELLEEYDNAQGMLTEEAIERVQEIADATRTALRERLKESA